MRGFTRGVRVLTPLASAPARVHAVREVLLEVPGVVVVGCDGEFDPLVDALDGVVLRVEFDDCELEPRRSIDADHRPERLARRADGVGGRPPGLRGQRRDADRVIVLEKVPVELVVGFSPLALPAERRVVLRVHRRIFPVAEALADEVGERPERVRVVLTRHGGGGVGGGVTRSARAAGVGARVQCGDGSRRDAHERSRERFSWTPIRLLRSFQDFCAGEIRSCPLPRSYRGTRGRCSPRTFSRGGQSSRAAAAAFVPPAHRDRPGDSRTRGGPPR